MRRDDELIMTFPAPFRSRGHSYTITVRGFQRPEGTWEGYVEFVGIDRGVPSLRTPRETTQPNRQSLFVWASGLEPVYFDGAWERAVREGEVVRAG